MTSPTQPQQRTEEAQARGYMPVSQKDDWETPKALFDALDREFGPFDLDPCGQREHHYSAYTIHARGGGFFDGSTAALDGLLQDWYGRVYMNPPYGRAIVPWIEKAAREVAAGRVHTVVGLLPARTDTRWWQAHILKEAAHDRIAAAPCIELVRFLPGRVKFGGAAQGATFPSVVVVWRQQP